MGSLDARRPPVTHKLVLLSMSSSADQKNAVKDALNHPSLQDLQVLDLDTMAGSRELEETADLVVTPVAYERFKERMYVCLQASLDAPFGDCKVIIFDLRGLESTPISSLEHFTLYNRRSTSQSPGVGCTPTRRSPRSPRRGQAEKIPGRWLHSTRGAPRSLH